MNWTDWLLQFRGILPYKIWSETLSTFTRSNKQHKYDEYDEVTSLVMGDLLEF